MYFVRKKIVKFSMLPALLALIFLSFSKKQNESSQAVVVSDSIRVASLPGTLYSVDSLPFHYPVLQKNYLGFKQALGFKESQNNYERVNEFGYLGKYQFNKNTLALLGVYNTTNFMHSPKLQEAAFYAYVSRNKWVLRKYIQQYSGKKIDGVTITPSGILAAAHLAGPGGVKQFLRSGGRHSAADAFGTSIEYYMKKFGGYDVSFIPANRSARVELPSA